MPKQVHAVILMIFAPVAGAAEPAFPPECPSKGTMELVGNPAEWADQCFKAVNGRLPRNDDSGQTNSMDRDIDLDGIAERLEIRGVGNKLKQIYAFKGVDDGFRYLGKFDANPAFFVAKDQSNQTYLLNIYRMGAEAVYLQYIQYRDGEFVVVREEPMQ
jgi:hypothetical protein